MAALRLAGRLACLAGRLACLDAIVADAGRAVTAAMPAAPAEKLAPG
jgi:hypothetical protein